MRSGQKFAHMQKNENRGKQINGSDEEEFTVTSVKAGVYVATRGASMRGITWERNKRNEID